MVAGGRIKIGICGKQNSGKSLVADLLYSLFLPDMAFGPMRVMAFADPIKDIGQMMFPWADKNAWYGSSERRNEWIPDADDKDGKPLTYRQVLIDLGTLARSYDYDHWVKVFDATIKNKHLAFVVCPDIRFRNEFEYLKKEGFFLIKLQRDTVSTSTNSTETAQDSIRLEEFDAIVANNGTIEDLQEKLKAIKDDIIAKCR